MNQNYTTIYEDALQSLKASDGKKAFQIFRQVLAYPAQLESSEQWLEAWSLFGQIGAAIAGEVFAKKVMDVAVHSDDLNALYQLGYELIEFDLPDIAATVLARANMLHPGDEAILTELVAALERAGFHQAACDYLRASGALLAESFICRYLLAFNAIMAGDLAEPRQLLPTLQKSQNESHLSLVQRIAGMVRRAEVLENISALDYLDLRGWHVVLTGAILLHISPAGFDEGMHGRYAYVQDSEALCLEGMQRLKAVLDAWQVSVPRVFALPERKSAILAQAMAQYLHCPVEKWSDEGRSAAGLIMAYDLKELSPEILSTLHIHRPGQILWSHASCWTEEFPFAADLTTYLYQFNTSPWEGGLRIDPDTGRVQQGSPVEGDIEKLSASVLNASLESEALIDLPTLVELAKAIFSVSDSDAAGGLKELGRRRRQWASSPVASNRFV